jgi:hypothetical protein
MQRGIQHPCLIELEFITYVKLIENSYRHARLIIRIKL